MKYNNTTTSNDNNNDNDINININNNIDSDLYDEYLNSPILSPSVLDPGRPLYNSNKYATYDIDHTPRWLHCPYILSGYRVYLSWKLCFLSVFHIHNETGNVWTHLIGLFYICWLSVHSFVFVIYDSDIGDKLVFLLFFICSCLCMSASTLFHLCACHSERTFVKLYRCDLIGISSLILGSYIPGLYYGFTCAPIYQYIYCITITLGCLGAMIIPFVRQCKQSTFHCVRVSYFVILVSGCLIPIIHWRYLVHQLQPDRELDAQYFTYRLAIMLGLYFIGFLFYMTKWPERLFPGQFDIWLHSHQFWHLFVLLALISWHNTLIEMYQYNSTYKCPQIN